MTGTRAKPSEEDDLKLLIQGIKTTMEAGFKSLNLKIDTLSSTIETLQQENNSLKSEVESLREMINQREQHHRNQSLRINGFNLSNEAETNALRTAKEIYTQLFYPILRKAQKEGVIEEVPKVMEVIEMAHTLPSKKSSGTDTPKQIIVRLQSRLIRGLLFRYKNRVLTESKYKGIYFSDDLTRLNFIKVMEHKKDPLVQSVWSTGGHIFYTLKANPSQKKRL